MTSVGPDDVLNIFLMPIELMLSVSGLENIAFILLTCFLFSGKLKVLSESITFFVLLRRRDIFILFFSFSESAKQCTDIIGRV